MGQSEHDGRLFGDLVRFAAANNVPAPGEDLAVRRRDGNFAVRNMALQLVAKYAGEERMYQGALWLPNDQEMPRHYIDEVHVRSLMAERREQAIGMAKLACAACPIAADCGLGPEDLRKGLLDPRKRRRLVSRVKNRRAENNHYCATNLAPPRLKDKVA